jgi:hypothetical protein
MIHDLPFSILETVILVLIAVWLVAWWQGQRRHVMRGWVIYLVLALGCHLVVDHPRWAMVPAYLAAVLAVLGALELKDGGRWAPRIPIAVLVTLLWIAALGTPWMFPSLRSPAEPTVETEVR